MASEHSDFQVIDGGLGQSPVEHPQMDVWLASDVGCFGNQMHTLSQRGAKKKQCLTTLLSLKKNGSSVLHAVGSGTCLLLPDPNTATYAWYRFMWLCSVHIFSVWSWWWRKGFAYWMYHKNILEWMCTKTRIGFHNMHSTCLVSGKQSRQFLLL